MTKKKDWLDEAIELAQRVARRPPHRRAAREAGGARRRGDRRSTAGLEVERRLYELAMATEDRVEGMDAFLEKRKPEFKGTMSAANVFEPEFDEPTERAGLHLPARADRLAGGRRAARREPVRGRARRG